MALPTRIARIETAHNTTITKTNGPYTCLAGDMLVIKAVAGQANPYFVTLPSGVSGAVFTSIIRCPVGPALDASSALTQGWACTVPTNQTVTVSMSYGAGGETSGYEVIQYRDHGGIGISALAGVSNPTVGVPSITLNGISVDSIIEYINADWNAGTFAGTVYRTTDAGSFTELSKAIVAPSQYTYWDGYYANAGAAGNKVVGQTAPTGQSYAAIAFEVLGLAGATYQPRRMPLGV